MRIVAVVLSTLWTVLSGGLWPAGAWNDTGHQVVALIAWDNLLPAARSKLVAAMRQAPPESQLPGLFPHDHRPLEAREREFFRRAATWADLIRAVPELHHSTWHHRDFYWKQQSGQAIDLPDLQVNPENLLERLRHFKARLADSTVAAAQRATEIAWVLHLVGDIHQPLHCSGRVTSVETYGDHGGNDFKLTLLPEPNPQKRRHSLHGYWDDMVDKAFRRQVGEAFSAYLQRSASLIVARHPRALLEGQLEPGQFDVWARESVVAAQHAYPVTLRRNREPPTDYRLMGVQVARERVALAGYRLALMLKEVANVAVP
jgi:hypothetical protein